MARGSRLIPTSSWRHIVSLPPPPPPPLVQPPSGQFSSISDHLRDIFTAVLFSGVWLVLVRCIYNVCIYIKRGETGRGNRSPHYIFDSERKNSSVFPFPYFPFFRLGALSPKTSHRPRPRPRLYPTGAPTS